MSCCSSVSEKSIRPYSGLHGLGLRCAQALKPAVHALVHRRRLSGLGIDVHMRLLARSDQLGISAAMQTMRDFKAFVIDAHDLRRCVKRLIDLGFSKVRDLRLD